MPALDELERAWEAARADASFAAELTALLGSVVGRPTPLYEAERFSERAGRRVFLKRERSVGPRESAGPATTVRARGPGRAGAWFAFVERGG